jgi:DNA mismatch endonuclease (patch repair protein)
MADTISIQKRSKNMQNIKSKNTKPELQLRSLLCKMGYHFCLHSDNLPGKPDIVLSKHGTIIFVHGCFWHQHYRCRDGTMPKSHVRYWSKKLTDNKKRDLRNMRKLRQLGWNVIRLWECEIEKHPKEVMKKLNRIKGARI